MQAMLPKDAETVYGKGVAGDMWKSMMAEKLAPDGRTRRHRHLGPRARDHYHRRRNEGRASAVSGGPEKAGPTRARACRRRWSRKCSGNCRKHCRRRRAVEPK